jgi:hypothetical protein
MNLMEYANRDATGFLQLLHTQDITPRDVLECAYTAIDTFNPRLNAVVQVFQRDRPPVLAHPLQGLPCWSRLWGWLSMDTLSRMGVPIAPPIRPPRMHRWSRGLQRLA